MNDMRSVIMPKSDQLNNDSLLGGPITITITEVTIRPGTEQPISVFYEGGEGLPYKPCKSMARVMVHCWGPDANQYVGRSMILYSDPNVIWGGMKVGGIRISHMSDLDSAQTMALTATKGNRKPFTVKPMPKAAPAVDKVTVAVNALIQRIETVESVEALDAITGDEQVTKQMQYLRKNRDDLAKRVDAAIEKARTTHSPAPVDEDEFPGDVTHTSEAPTDNEPPVSTSETTPEAA